MILLALDPGDKTTGFVIVSSERLEIIETSDAIVNEGVFEQYCYVDEIVCEDIVIPGRAGRETFQTARWIGRFQQRAADFQPRGAIPFHLMRRNVVANHLYPLCPRPMPQTADARIRGALVARFGKQELKAVKGHAMAALAVAVTFLDQYPLVRNVTAEDWSGIKSRAKPGWDRKA